MRILFFFIVYLFFSIQSYAYDSDLQKVTWVKDDSVFVKTIDNSYVYMLGYKEKYESYYSNSNSKYRETIDYTRNESKRIRKSKKLRVRGYANLKKQFHYDTYVVENKGILYFLPSKFVEDNVALDTINIRLKNKYNDFFERMEDYAKERDSLRMHYLPICRENLNYYRKKIDSLYAQIDSIEYNVKKEFEETKKFHYDKWYNSLPQSTKKVFDNILSIGYTNLTYPNSAGGCDYIFYYTNKSTKTIKYLYWTGTFYNAVNDPVYCDIHYSSSFTGKDTGPIKPNTDGGGRWECVIYNWSARYVNLSNITIIYTDGTKYVISGYDIKKLMTYNELRDNISTYSLSYTEIEELKKETKIKITETEKQIKQWEFRLNLLEKPPVKVYNDIEYEESYYTSTTDDLEEYNTLFKTLYSIYRIREEIKRDIKKFEQQNFIREFIRKY